MGARHGTMGGSWIGRGLSDDPPRTGEDRNSTRRSRSNNPCRRRRLVEQREGLFGILLAADDAGAIEGADRIERDGVAEVGGLLDQRQTLLRGAARDGVVDPGVADLAERGRALLFPGIGDRGVAAFGRADIPVAPRAVISGSGAGQGVPALAPAS